MKKLFIALTAALVLAGCSNGGAGGNALDAASFTKQYESTEASAIRVYVTTEDSRANAAVDAKGNEELIASVKEILEGVEAEKAESQDKNYGTPYYFVELNGVLDENFMRFVVYEDGTLMVAGPEEFVNYTLTDAGFEALANAFEALVPAE